MIRPSTFIAEETNMEEARLTAYLFQKLLDAVFLTEHNMARQLGLSYKVLRRVQKAQRMTQKTADARSRQDLDLLTKVKILLKPIVAPAEQ